MIGEPKTHQSIKLHYTNQYFDTRKCIWLHKQWRIKKHTTNGIHSRNEFYCVNGSLISLYNGQP